MATTVKGTVTGDSSGITSTAEVIVGVVTCKYDDSLNRVPIVLVSLIS